MKVRLQEYALVAEIISAIAIVISLIFVGLQVGQSSAETAANSRALEATVRESMLNADLAILQSALPYSFILQRDPETEDERGQARIYFYMLNRSRENYWKQHSNGMLDDETYFSYRDNFINTLVRSDYALSAFDAGRDVLIPGFIAEIDEQLEKRGRIPRQE